MCFKTIAWRCSQSPVYMIVSMAASNKGHRCEKSVTSRPLTWEANCESQNTAHRDFYDFSSNGFKDNEVTRHLHIPDSASPPPATPPHACHQTAAHTLKHTHGTTGRITPRSRDVPM